MGEEKHYTMAEVAAQMTQAFLLGRDGIRMKHSKEEQERLIGMFMQVLSAGMSLEVAKDAARAARRSL